MHRRVLGAGVEIVGDDVSFGCPVQPRAELNARLGPSLQEESAQAGLILSTGDDSFLIAQQTLEVHGPTEYGDGTNDGRQHAYERGRIDLFQQDSHTGANGLVDSNQLRRVVVDEHGLSDRLCDDTVVSTASMVQLPPPRRT